MQADVLFFGDQSVLPCARIRQLKREATKCGRLQDFFAAADQLWRTYQVAQQRQKRSGGSGDTQSLLDLAERQSGKGSRDVVESTLLLCVAQLGGLVLVAEDNPASLWCSSEVYITGLCTGLLPAVLAATVPAPRDIVPLALEILSLSLRLAAQVRRRSRTIEDSLESWAVVRQMTAKAVQPALDSFNQDQKLPPYRHAYISADFGTSVTISGPPSTLALLRAAEPFTQPAKAELLIAAAYHAPHLDMNPSTADLLTSSNIPDLPLRKNAKLISSHSGLPYEASSMHGLLAAVFEDILQRRLCWRNIFDGLGSALKNTDVALTVIEPTVMADQLSRGLTSAGAHVTEQHKERCLRSPDIDRADAVAAVGMACRFPGADTVDEFWDILDQGRDLHRTIPNDRFDIQTHVDASGTSKNTSRTPYGCFLDQPGHFDTNIFGISPREARVIDPIQRLLLMTTYEALEAAGYANADGRRVATFFGQATDDWRETNASQDIDLYYVPGGMRAFGPGRLNYHFKWEGPSYSVDTACSSSTAAVEMACKALLAGDCDMAVVGGGNLLSGPQMFAGLSRGGFLSPTGSCKTLDQAADGYCRAEGVGVVVLKRLQDAVAERDLIQGVVASVATNHSAHATSITHPHAPTQKRLYQTVIQKALLQPADIGYVEMHGTGTQAGDATEVQSICSLFGNSHEAGSPLRIGAAKANVGHGEAAAGIISIIKSLLMLKKGVVPLHPGIKSELNHSLPPLTELNIEIPGSSRPFDRKRRRRIMVNNFNATGGNTSLVIEDYSREESIAVPDPREHHVVVISARTLKSLDGNKQRVLHYLAQHPDVRLPDVAYTTTARRMHHVYRTAYSIRTPLELREAISADLAAGATTHPHRMTGNASTVFVFTGQGSQYPAMGRDLFQTCQVFRDSILECDAISTSLGHEPFVDLILSGDTKALHERPLKTQLALISLQLALVAMWKSWGVMPDLVLGHSLGEYAALCTAGVLSVRDALYIVGKRAQILEQLCPPYTHSMMAIEAPVDTVRAALVAQGLAGCTVSCINSPSSTVVSGRLETLQTLRAAAGFQSVRMSSLRVPFAFHSPHVEPALGPLEAALASIRFNAPAVPVISSLTGEAVDKDGVFSASYLVRQTRQPVNFLRATRTCRERLGGRDDHVWLEIGPAPVCVGLAQSTVMIPPGRAVCSLRPKNGCWKTISDAAARLYEAGVDVDWARYHSENRASLHLLEMPTYAFDTKNFWIRYEGDWALMGRHAVKAPPPAAAAAAAAALLATCLQRVEHEAHDEAVSTVVFSSDLREPRLFDAIQGHLVHGLGLCPSSVFTDMALTAAAYLAEQIGATTGNAIPAMDVSHMHIVKPLVVLPGKPDEVFIKVRASRTKGSNRVEVSFTSEGACVRTEHARCTIELECPAVWKRDWDRMRHLVQTRCDALADAARTGQAHDIRRDVVYKLFASLVVYSDRYRTLHEVYLHNTLHEAAASLQFCESPSGSASREERFTVSPYWLDGIVHLGGFALNGHVQAPAQTSYICTGWESLRVPTDLVAGRAYSGYAHMQPAGPGLFVGDVFLLDDGEIVAACRGLKFQQMRTRSLQVLLAAAAGRGEQGFASTPDSSLPSASPPHSGGRTSRSTGTSPTEKSSRSTNPGSPIARIREIIAAEADLPASQLATDVRFQELGIDSLLTTRICSEIQRQTGIMISLSDFETYPTVSALLGSIARNASSVSPPPEPSASEAFDHLLSAVSVETGIDREHIKPSATFEELGVDSLLSMAVLSRLKDECGMNIPSTFFRDHPTIASARAALAARDDISPPPTQPTGHNWASQAILIHGNPKRNAPALFLVADGSGSPASYQHLPRLPCGTAVYGLQSPFCHMPTQWTCTFSFEAVGSMYKAAVRQIQPRGPYLIGGWSLGGMHAFEVARQLLLEGQCVRGLLLIDAPSPALLSDVPEPTLQVLESIGLFGALHKAGIRGAALDRAQQHLLHSIRSLNRYTPMPMDPDHRPEAVSIIWGARGVFEELGGKVVEAVALRGRGERRRDERCTEEMDRLQGWMSAPRKEFGPNGWERLLAGAEINCHRTEGDHFSMMNPPLVEQTGQLIAQVLEALLAPDGRLSC